MYFSFLLIRVLKSRILCGELTVGLFEFSNRQITILINRYFLNLALLASAASSARMLSAVLVCLASIVVCLASIDFVTDFRGSCNKSRILRYWYGYWYTWTD